MEAGQAEAEKKEAKEEEGGEKDATERRSSESTSMRGRKNRWGGEKKKQRQHQKRVSLLLRVRNASAYKLRFLL